MQIRLPLLLAVLAIAITGCQRNSECLLPNLDISQFDTLGNDKKRPATVHITPCKEVFSGKRKQSARVKTRGGYSIGFPKKNYTVSLDKKVSMSGWPASKHYILGANYIDKTFLRNKLAYDLFRAFDERNVVSRSMFVTASINGEYNGLYVLHERMDKQRLAIQDSMIGASIFKDPMIFIDTVTDNEQPPDDYFHQKHPDLADTNMNDVMYQVWEFLKHADDSTFSADVGRWFDMRCVVDWHLLLLVTNNGDGVKKNFYLFRRSTDEPFQICPWDYDGSFGRDGDNELQSISFPDWRQSNLLKRLTDVNVEGYNQRLSARYKQLRNRGVLSSERFLEMVEHDLQSIRPHVERNFQLWPENAGWPYEDENTFEQEVELIQNWLATRVDTVDAFFARWDKDLLVED